jgi:hypothetical protein
MCLSFRAVTDETCSYGSENWWECRMGEGKRTLRLIKICEIYCQVAESVVMFVSALHISQGEDTEIFSCLCCTAHSIWRTCLWQNKIKCGLICLMNQQDVWAILSLQCQFRITCRSLHRVWENVYIKGCELIIVEINLHSLLLKRVFLLKSKDCSIPHTHARAHTHTLFYTFLCFTGRCFLIYLKSLCSVWAIALS